MMWCDGWQPSVYACGCRAKGGTNWAQIELTGAQQADRAHYAPFLSYGLMLPDAIAQARVSRQPVYNCLWRGSAWLDAAKCLWLGADLVGMAGQILRTVKMRPGHLHPSS